MNLYKPLFVILFWFFLVGCIALFVFTYFKDTPKKDETPITNTGENVCEGPDCDKTLQPPWEPITLPTPAPLPTGDTEPTAPETTSHVCEDLTCRAALRINEYMDEKASPCQDFYEYACGGWRKSNPLQDNEIKKGPIFSLIDKVAGRMKDLLSSEETTTDLPHVVAAKSYFASCVNTERIIERGAEPMLNLLHSIGSFPALNSSWTPEEFDLTKILIKFDAIGVMPLMRIAVEKSALYNNEFKIHIRVPLTDQDMGVIKPGKEKSMLEDYLDFLGANATNDINAIIELNKNIADIENSAQYTDPRALNMMDLERVHTWLNWTQLLQARFDEAKLGISVKEQTTVIISRDGYFRALKDIINSISKRVLSNFLLSQTQSLSIILGRELLISGQDLDMGQNGMVSVPRWRRCVNDMMVEMHDALGRMYVEKYYANFNKQPIERMAMHLKDEFNDLVQRSSWISDSTKAATKESLQALTFHIGYPDYIFENHEAELYELIKGGTEFFEAKLACYKRLITEDTRKLKPNSKKWVISPANVDVVYDPDNHDITIPVAILDEPYYNPEYSSSMNYGGLGFIIGHEITDSFKITSPSANGEVVNDTASYDDTASYEKRLECLKNQFSSYTWGEHNVNGEQNVYDNLADQGGMMQSYLALQHLNGVGDQKVPGSDLNPNQLFFVSLAQGWCSLYKDDVKLAHIQSDMHAPHEVRIRGMMRNSKEFAEAFSCPSDEAPVKCTVFDKR